MARVTVQKIADHLGISKFAVSRALTGKTGVSDETRRLVIDTASAFGYVSRPRSVPSTDGIEIIFHDPDVAHRELWVDVQAGVQIEGAKLGMATAVRWTADTSEPARLLANAAGFILIGPHDAAMLEAATATGAPCVRIGPLATLLDPMDQVSSADREGTGAIAEHLLSLGHRKFVYAHGRPGYPGRIERLQSFRAALEAQPGIGLRELVFPDDDQPGNFRDAIVQMVAEDFVPTAFFCGNDDVAVTVVSEFLRMGLRVPEDVSVVGFADYPIATQIAPRLTTVRSPHREMGAAAVRLIMSRLGLLGPRNDLPPQRLALVGKLIVRESTGPVAKTSWVGSLRERP